ncbi:protein of unknown function [Legionella fallonii LLAP-10]|uniref:Uncharacterized protein n=1 Tax=Legionella fallonii LLAP-10 TaxID=1212491 RepID=A0A098G557_9GAMM|nr:protein of unknown function [Legionella fallonii LLAP-10]
MPSHSKFDGTTSFKLLLKFNFKAKSHDEVISRTNRCNKDESKCYGRSTPSVL